MAAHAYDFTQLEPPVARAPAVDVLADAAAELESLRSAAAAEGFEEGRAEALAAVAPALAALEEAAAEHRVHAEGLGERLEREAVELALLLAERVLAGALAVDPERVVEAVRGALRGITERTRVTVLVNPEDLGLVRAAADGLRSSMGGIEHLEVQAERRVARGGAVVRHAEGEVDATVATKLDRARELVEAALS
jgi:flagellar assembly protein FliH